jgi:hypothetical protein
LANHGTSGGAAEDRKIGDRKMPEIAVIRGGRKRGIHKGKREKNTHAKAQRRREEL